MKVKKFKTNAHNILQNLDYARTIIGQVIPYVGAICKQTST